MAPETLQKEKATDIVAEMRKRLEEGSQGGSLPEQVLFIPKTGAITIRFLSEFNKPVEVKTHQKWEVLRQQPCLQYYGKPCPYHTEEFRDGMWYVFTVFDYKAEDKRLVLVAPTSNSIMTDLFIAYDKRQTIKDRDWKLFRVGKGKKVQYRADGDDPTPYDIEKYGKFQNPIKDTKVFEYLAGMIKDPSAPKPKQTDETSDNKDEPTKPASADED